MYHYMKPFVKSDHHHQPGPPSIRLWQTGGAHRGSAALGQGARGKGEGARVVGAKALFAEDAVLESWGVSPQVLPSGELT